MSPQGKEEDTTPTVGQTMRLSTLGVFRLTETETESRLTEAFLKVTEPNRKRLVTKNFGYFFRLLKKNVNNICSEKWQQNTNEHLIIDIS